MAQRGFICSESGSDPGLKDDRVGRLDKFRDADEPPRMHQDELGSLDCGFKDAFHAKRLLQFERQRVDNRSM